jgi:cyclic pyranopterin phosphate synthase
MMYELERRGARVRIGVIPPMTHKFCSRCNRLRLTSNGRLKTCLYSSDDVDLMGPLRQGAGDGDLIGLVKSGLIAKKEGHNIECSSDEGGCHAIIAHSMSRIGG